MRAQGLCNTWVMQQAEQTFGPAPSSQRETATTSIRATSSSVADRLAAYAILPPHHDALDDRTLAMVEELFITWFEMTDDESRRATIPYLFKGDEEARRTLLAIVPLYFDPLFFDDLTPTRELITLALATHRKWRTWMDESRI